MLSLPRRVIILFVVFEIFVEFIMLVTRMIAPASAFRTPILGFVTFLAFVRFILLGRSVIDFVALTIVKVTFFAI